MEPAASIIAKLGGEKIVSAITQTAYTAPYRWKAPKNRGGTGGLIPQKYQSTLLRYARDNAIDLRAEEFVAGLNDSIALEKSGAVA